MKPRRITLDVTLMQRTAHTIGLLVMLACSSPGLAEPKDAKTGDEAIHRAIGYLAREVPRWNVKNKCYSCHNNGDAARALAMAKRRGFKFDDRALTDTARWLRRPDQWKHNGGEGAPSDKRLASIQFSAALAGLIDAGIVKDPSPLVPAATLVAGFQAADGSWKIDAKGSIGSPVTYGRSLATAMSLRSLTAVEGQRFDAEIKQARQWLREAKPQTVLDSAAVLIGLGSSRDRAAAAQRETCAGLIQKGQHTSGGWGPFVTSPVEVFDTAVVLLALAGNADIADRTTMMRRGRKVLIETQYDDGSWPETTRPAGAESYAQRISTTAWAALALLATADVDRKDKKQ